MPASSRPPRPLSDPGRGVAAFVARSVVRCVAALPAGVVDALARAGGWLAWTLRIRRRVVEENLRHAFLDFTPAQRRRIGRGAYLNMARAALEGLRGVRLPEAALEQAVEVDWGAMGADLAAGRGVLVASAHLGSWELLAEVMTRRGVRASAVVRPLRGAFNAELVRARQQSGLKLIAARGALRGMLSAVRQGEMVIMLLDQAIPPAHGVFVPFFGRPASTSPALALAAIRTGAPLYVLVAAREGGRLRMFVEGPIPVPQEGELHARVEAVTARLTAELERFVRRYPEQWLWLHRRWKYQP